MKRRIANGTKVWIKENVDSWAAGEWGVIRDFDGENYYIAIADTHDMELIFIRNEFVVHRKQNRTKEKPERLKVYDLYCDGDKIGTALWEWEVKELKREYIKNYAEMGRVPRFVCVEDK